MTWVVVTVCAGSSEPTVIVFVTSTVRVAQTVLFGGFLGRFVTVMVTVRVTVTSVAFCTGGLAFASL